jgi:hypothetical protein
MSDDSSHVDGTQSGLSVDHNSAEIHADFVEIPLESDENLKQVLNCNPIFDDFKKLDDATIGTDDLKKW